MTWQDILDRLAALAPVYELAAPGAVKRCIVWHVYGSPTLRGDDRKQLSWMRIQLDILTQSSSDPLPGQVTDILDDADAAWQDVDSAYDPDYALWRSIVQIEVA